MSTWTNDARLTLEGYLERNRGRAATSGADGDEVVADLRRHIEAEVSALELPVVTQDDVQRIVARIGPVPAEEQHREDPTKPAGAGKARSLGIALFFFGVILPLIAIGFELVTRLCTGNFFDPLPTLAHTILVALVPVSNALAWLVAFRKKMQLRRSIWLLNGVAFGVSLFYGLLFLPMAPFAVIGIIYFGLGLVPLAPICAFICAWLFRTQLRQEALTRVKRLEPSLLGEEPESAFLGRGMRPLTAGNGHSNGATARCARAGFGRSGLSEQAPAPSIPLRGWVWASLAPIVLLGVFALPGPLTRYWVDQTASEVPEQSTRAIQRLRLFGSEESLLKECYGRGDRLWIEVFGGRRPNTELAREAFYRVTGKPFNAFPPPVSKYQRAGRSVLSEFDWDTGLGGDSVAGQVRGLSLLESRLDGISHPDQGWSYLEWTLEFKNVHESSQREARAQIQLPPGGVVSRVTLWVNGEEREAAFAGRSQVREAYQKVAVQQRRDPVLVTTSGPDRVLMQCFPIQPRGGSMKVRLGITAPLLVESPDQAALKLPSILERNFAVKETARHRLWLESAQQPSTKLSGLLFDKPKSGTAGLRGDITDQELNSINSVLRFPLTPGAQIVWAKDRKSENASIIRQRLESVPGKMPTRLAIVLDGSQDMTEAFPRIASALDGLPSQPETAVWLAQDGIRQIYHDAWSSPEPLSATVGNLRGVGGQDDLPALLQAWEWAAAKDNSVLLWIHGPQPVLVGSIEALKQRLEWRANGGGPSVVEVATKPGPNRITEQLSNLDAVISHPRLGDLESDLERLFATWSGRRSEFQWTREVESEAGPADLESEPKASSQVVRLWAHDRIRFLTKIRKVAEAIQLAGLYQLVTPVSGAVVLETAQQFNEAGLTPVDSASVPTIPEPSTWALIALGSILIFSRAFRAVLRRCGAALRVSAMGVLITVATVGCSQQHQPATGASQALAMRVVPDTNFVVSLEPNGRAIHANLSVENNFARCVNASDPSLEGWQGQFQFIGNGVFMVSLANEKHRATQFWVFNDDGTASIKEIPDRGERQVATPTRNTDLR
jgi:hypothetical protein